MNYFSAAAFQFTAVRGSASFPYNEHGLPDWEQHAVMETQHTAPETPRVCKKGPCLAGLNPRFLRNAPKLSEIIPTLGFSALTRAMLMRWHFQNGS